MHLDRSGLDVLCAIAERAGEAIMEVYAQPDIQASSKADASPLTEADLRADAIIREGLAAAFPAAFVLTEEGANEAAIPETFFLVDPLDGTKEFLKRNGEFTVNIALVVRGRPEAGVVLAPALGELFFASKDVGAFKREHGHERRIRVEPAVPHAALRVMGSRSHSGPETQAWLSHLSRPFTLVEAGSSLKFCRIAEGAADVYPRLGPTCQWDTAAGQAVLEQAGGAVLDGSGRPLEYGGHRPILNPHFVAVADPAAGFPPLGP